MKRTTQSPIQRSSGSLHGNGRSIVVKGLPNLVRQNQPYVSTGLPSGQIQLNKLNKDQNSISSSRSPKLFQSQQFQPLASSPNHHDHLHAKNSFKQKEQHRVQAVNQIEQHNKDLTDLQWPLFKINNDPAVKKFWDRKTQNDQDRVWFQKTELLLFTGGLLRIGKKKKQPKGYYYRLRQNGILLYFKKESDSSPKGYLQLSLKVRCQVIKQTTKKHNIVPVIYIERSHGVGITIFDHRIESTLQFFNSLKTFCLVRGFENFYSQMELLGKGSFASVYKVEDVETKKIFAAKTYYREVYEESTNKDKFMIMVQNEVMILREMKHPGIIELYEIIQDKEKLVLIMEFVEGGDIYSLIKKRKHLPERPCSIILRGCADALNELHKSEFVHRDLKLENIMLESRENFTIKLVDFGFAEKINYKALVSKAGTPGFIPPEIFKSHPYTSKGDIFSLGVIIYSLVSGDALFKAKNYQGILKENQKCHIEYKSYWNDISEEFKKIVQGMLEVRPERRLSAQDILENTWLQHYTKVGSEMTQFYSVGQSGFESPQVGIKKSIKSYKNNQSHDVSEDQEYEFENDFQYTTNQLKSFYMKNSMKTVKTVMTEKSNIQQSLQVRDTLGDKMFTEEKHHLSIKKKSQSMKQFYYENQDQKQKNPKLHKTTYMNQASFGNKSQFDKDESPLQDQFTDSNFQINEDFVSLTYENLMFLKMSNQTFNQKKIQKEPFFKKNISKINQQNVFLS